MRLSFAGLTDSVLEPQSFSIIRAKVTVGVFPGLLSEITGAEILLVSTYLLHYGLPCSVFCEENLEHVRKGAP